MKARNKKQELELLAPAKNADIGIEAIKHGADAVYIGATKFGARAAAGNSIDDILRLVTFAHQFNAKVYVTINTILYDSELNDVRDLIYELYKIGVDALIVQDMGLLRMDLPPISLHASTQTDIRTPQKAKFLERVGFSQLVLARELSLSEIRDIASTTDIPLEVFIHGALCVSYSGRCQVSEATMNRSANRGECAQLCRMAYNLTDEEGNILISNKHLLSLRDFNLSNQIESLILAGASSFKIEGRLKDIGYVKNVVSYYRKKIDSIISKYPDKYTRSSVGRSHISFEPSLEKSFNRSFTEYFVNGRQTTKQMASIHTPKSQGEYLGKVVSTKGKILRIKTNVELANGDGISFFKDNVYSGARINKVNGQDLVLSTPLAIRPGCDVFRTFNKEFEDLLAKDSARRTIDIEMSLSYKNSVLSLDISDERGNKISHTELCELEPAKAPQGSKQMSLLGKLGNTIYIATSIKTIDTFFIPASILSDLKRKAIEKLDAAQRIRYHYSYRKAEDKEALFPTNNLTYADNVANNRSIDFYHSHGIESIEKALEVQKDKNVHDRVVMNTRYCIRRELGCCKKGQNRNKLPESLYLRNGIATLKIEFDCKKCEMNLKYV